MTINIACTSCRAPNMQGAKFCRQCGMSMTKAEVSSLSANACASCGLPFVGNQKFCRGCGQPLALMEVEESATSETSPVSAQPAQASAAESDAIVQTQQTPSQQYGSPRQRADQIAMASMPSSNQTAITRTRRRKWPWVVASVFLVTSGIAATLVYQGKLTMPRVAQRLVQDYVPVRVPEFNVGDSWVYETTTSDSRDPREFTGRDTYQVNDISGDRITMAPMRDGTDEHVRVMNLYGNEIEDTVTYGRERFFEQYEGEQYTESYNPPLRYYDFPLLPGKTWTSSTIYNAPSRTSGSNEITVTPTKLTITGKVIGWEYDIGRLDGVMVDGLKIQREIKAEQLGRHVGDAASITTATEWYVPSAGRAVLRRSVMPFPNDYRGPSAFNTTEKLTNFIPSN